MSKLNTYGLEENALQRILSVFEEHKKISKVVLFGSRAKGNFATGSDIDISLVGQDLNFDDVLTISIQLEELNFPYKFDIILYKNIKEKALIEHIDRVGKVLYVKPSSA